MKSNLESGGRILPPTGTGASAFARKHLVWLLSAAIFVSVVWTYFPTLRNGFVAYDDPTYVTENAHVKTGLTLENLGWAFASEEASNWHPLTWISHMVDCQLFGLQAWGHHLTSVLIHALNSVLLFLLLRQMTGLIWQSLFVAAIFALHPLRVESVAWVAERKDVLSTLFWLLSMMAYARYARESNTKRSADNRRQAFFYFLSLAFFAMGLMSKPMVVTLPCVLLLLDFWPLRRFESLSGAFQISKGKPLLVEKIPFFLAAAAASAITVIAQNNGGALRTGWSLMRRFENALISYPRYLGKLFYPANLSAFYPYPTHWPVGLVLAALLFLLTITVYAVANYRKRPYLITGWFWFIITLIPTLGLVQVGVQAMADRYSYVPSIGAFILLIWSVDELTRGWRLRAALLSSIGLAVALAAIVLTRHQIAYWRDGETLFSHAIKVTRDNYMAHYFMGNILAKEGKIEPAIAEYRIALNLRPNVDFGIKFAKFLQEHGRTDEALAEYGKASNADPEFAEGHFDFATALSRQGRMAEAVEQYLQTLKLNPNYPSAENDLGFVFSKAGRMDEAIIHYQKAAALQPDSADIHYNLGNAFFRKGRVDDAIAQFQLSVQLNPFSATNYNNLAVALSRKGLVDEAISQFQAALKIQPNYVQAKKNLAAALALKRASKAPKPAP
jgi:protein O-mannosyl-transferase